MYRVNETGGDEEKTEDYDTIIIQQKKQTGEGKGGII